MKRVWGFLGRRFARGEYLGLHLTVGLLLSLFTLGMFIAVTRSIHEDKGSLEKFDVMLAQALEEHADQHSFTLEVMRLVTRAGGMLILCSLTLAGSLVLLVRGRRFEGMVWLFAAMAGWLFETLFKLAIARHRPVYPDYAVIGDIKATFSFPSGHAMGSLVAYGMLAYLLVLRLKHAWAQVAVVAGLGLLVLAIGFSRIYLRAHYFSDVLGGFSVGAVWLAVCVSGLELVRLHRKIGKAEGNPDHE